MNSPSEDIADHLFDKSLGRLRINMFVGILPADPDNCFVIRDTGGFDPDAHVDYERPTIQILVRDKSYQAAYKKMRAIRDELKSNISITKGGSRYVAVWQQGDILLLGTDEKDRIEMSLNFRIHRTGEIT